MAVDLGVLEMRIAAVARRLALHVGTIELCEVSDDGAVEIAFGGMCTACPSRPITLAATVRPALLDVPGVTSVRARGVRISADAERRLLPLTVRARHRTRERVVSTTRPDPRSVITTSPASTPDETS